jgi:hypothetical protein
MPKDAEVLTPEILVPETVVAKSRPFYAKPRFIVTVLGVLILIGVGAWLFHVFSVYRNAKEYKKAYDIVNTELSYCDSIKTQKESQNVFNYCDMLSDKFKGIERGK